MNYKLVISITAIAIALAENIEDNDELGLLSVALIQLGSTLRTIIAQRLICAIMPEVSEVPSSSSE